MKNSYLLGGIFILVIVIAAGTTAVLATKYVNSKDAKQVTSCQDVGGAQNHVVIIENDKVNPQKTTLAYCDTLTITNKDNKTRLMAFGVHEKHTAYDGVEEKELTQGQSLTVTAVTKGTFTFHDHEQDEVEGEFTVN